MNSTALDDTKVHVKLKLSALWAAVMFCYIYGDYFGLYAPGKLAEILAGKMEPLGPATQGMLMGVAIMMVVPSIMVFLSLVLPPALNRWANIVLGAAYTAIMLMTIPGAWAFYILLGIIEVVLTALIVWYAWNWPKRATT